MTAALLRHPTYEERVSAFNWSIAELELGYVPRAPINVGWHCSDRICHLGLGDRAALVWENFRGQRETFTYDEVRVLSNTAARYLQSLGVIPGQRVSLLLDAIPELYIGLLGVLKMGGIAQPMRAAMPEDLLSAALAHAATTAIVTQRKHLAKIRAIRDRLLTLRHVIVVDPEGIALQGGEAPLALRNEPRVEQFDAYPSTSETASIVYYTFDSAGQPRGALHVHYALISQYLTTKWALDLKREDVYWCSGEQGSPAATSYGIIGPWSNGVTQVVLDGPFDAERCYRFIQDHNVSIWFAEPRSIQSLMREGTDRVHAFDLSSLRHLASCNEVLRPDLLLWSQQAFGLAFHGTFCQPETGCIVFANLPGTPLKAGSMGKPFPGITASVINADTLQPIHESGRVGVVAIRTPWPSMFRAYWNDHAAYRARFKGDWYVTGEHAFVDSDGYFWPAEFLCADCNH